MFPRWSPDEHAILFSRDAYSGGQHGSDLFVVNPDGTGQTNLTNEGGARGRARERSFLLEYMS